MARNRRTVRKMVFGVGLGLAVVAGASACGSSSTKTNTNTPANAPTNSTPATTAPSGGGVSY